jgi:methionyl aminopeptidase
MITFKGPDEFAKMAKAGRVVAEIHEKLRAAARPGTRLIDLDALAAEITSRRNAVPSFLNYHGYPAHVCLSPNEVIVHGIPDDRRVREGDVLSLDAGAIVDGWHADAAITFGIGEISEEARRLIETTEAGMWAGIEQCRPGARLGDVGAAIQAVADRAGFGVVREYTGHGIGRQMHEEPQVLNYGTRGRGMKLKAGMAVCIEPMFNLGGRETRVLEDGWSVVTADGSISAHWEHTVAITADGPQVLTGPD